MPTLSEYKNVGSKDVPRDVRELRKHALEFLRSLGQPMVFKRRKTQKDVDDGKAVLCPFHDEGYNQSRATCPYCFGTGILGGFDDGIIVPIAVSDAQEDTYRITDAGILARIEHPSVIAPWTPLMKDSDLLIMADFDPNNFSVIETHDRFQLREVTPTTVRGGPPIGFATNRNRGGLNFTQRHDMIVDQKMQIDRLPESHVFYQVPIDDDNVVYPFPDQPPPGHDPDDPWIPDPSLPVTSSKAVVLKLIGSNVGTGANDDDVDVFYPAEYS